MYAWPVTADTTAATTVLAGFAAAARPRLARTRSTPAAAIAASTQPMSAASPASRCGSWARVSG